MQTLGTRGPPPLLPPPHVYTVIRNTFILELETKRILSEDHKRVVLSMYLRNMKESGRWNKNLFLFINYKQKASKRD